MLYKPHSEKQYRALFSEKPLVVVASGIQWGKTSIGALWLKMLMHQYTSADDNFIITSPTFPILNQSTLPPFLRMMDGYGTYNRSDNAFRMYKGGTCWFRTNKNPDSVVGITNVRGILCDEAGLYTLYFWENIQGRAAFKAAPIRIVTSPYSLNWLYQNYIKPWKKDPSKMPDVEIIQARSDENPYFPKAEYERRKLTMEPRRFNMMFGGEFHKMAGLVYDCFEAADHMVKPLKLPIGTRYVAGVDWGTTNPFALTVRGITPDQQHYQVAEYYKTGLGIQDMIQIAKERKSVWGIDMFYADPSEPGYIQEFNRNGLTCVGANNDIRIGIDMQYELFKTRRFKIFEGMCPHTVDELESYHWPDPKDVRPDQDIKNANPVKQHDHLCDSLRYVTAMTYRGFKQNRPRLADEIKQETQQERIERLKRKKTHGNIQTESWG